MTVSSVRPPALALIAAAVMFFLCPFSAPFTAFAGDAAGADTANIIADTAAAPPENVWVTRVEINGLPKDLPQYGGSVPKSHAMYDAKTVKRTMRELSRFLAENGYPYSKIITSVISDDSTSASEGLTALAVIFAVEPDERVCHGQPVIAGAGGRTDVYFNDVRIVPGRLYNTADIDETIRRLSIRPYIRSASPASPVIIEDAPLCGDDSLRTAVTPIAIIENRGMAVEGALGYESGRGSESWALNGRVDLSFVNMLRYGEIAEVSYVGTSTMQRFRFSGAWPWIFDTPFEAGGALEFEVEDAGYGFFSGEVWGALEVNARWKGGIALKVSETVPGGSAGDQSYVLDDGADALKNPYVFYGADVFMGLIRERWERGKTVWELSGRTGSGTANRDRVYIRSKMELFAGVHQPIWGGYALAGRVCAKALFTDEEYLPPVESYRTGGHGSIRGYSDEEFAFRTVAYSQIEALYYFNKTGAVFIFIDGGAGWNSPEPLSLSSAKEMLGYGAGIRFPSRLGDVSIEWARNGSDGWSLGRVHVGVRVETR